MSRQTTRSQSGSGRTSLYDEITTKIIAELEAGRVPWLQPWGTAAAKAPLAMPKNARTGRFYSGINVLILWGSVIEHGFPVQGWLTFRQALGLGGNVRKGEHGTTVAYADRFIPDDEKKRARETGEEAQAIPFLKRFTVFNLAQCEGLPENLVVAAPPPEPGLIAPKVEAPIKASGIDFRISDNRTLYMPAHDYVQVPPPAARTGSAHPRPPVPARGSPCRLPTGLAHRPGGYRDRARGRRRTTARVRAEAIRCKRAGRRASGRQQRRRTVRDRQLLS